MALPKWTEERTSRLEEIVGNESPVTQATVARAAEELDTTTRSVSSKLRKMDYDVELASAAPKAFSEEQEAELRDFVEANRGEFTYGEIAERFDGGHFSPKAIQGKILSMQLTDAVRPTPKPESQKTYTDEEEQQVISMIEGGNYVEDIADALNRSVPSIRGKALSLLRAGEIDAMPKQRDVKAPAQDPLAALGDLSKRSVEDIAEALGKTARGVKTMLTRRGLTAADYDGAAKKEKAAANQ